MKIQLIMYLILLFSCKNQQVNQTNCTEIKKIVITNKFSKTSTNKETVFTDSTTLSNFCREIKSLQPVIKEPITKVNFGYYEIDVAYENNHEEHIEIIYTKFDGVIIRLDGKFYKNDELDSVMRGYLAPKEWQG